MRGTLVLEGVGQRTSQMLSVYDFLWHPFPGDRHALDRAAELIQFESAPQPDGDAANLDCRGVGGRKQRDSTGLAQLRIHDESVGSAVPAVQRVSVERVVDGAVGGPILLHDAGYVAPQCCVSGVVPVQRGALLRHFGGRAQPRGPICRVQRDLRGDHHRALHAEISDGSVDHHQFRVQHACEHVVAAALRLPA